MMLRSLPVIAAAAVFAAGCATGTQPEAAPETVVLPTVAPSTVTTTAAPVTTDDAEPATAPDPTTTTAAVIVDGPPAPDFTLALEDPQGVFILSEEQKPVYMVFWAEW
jgi:uncharacterized lipoprotein YajG